MASSRLARTIQCDPVSNKYINDVSGKGGKNEVCNKECQFSFQTEDLGSCACRRLRADKTRDKVSETRVSGAPFPAVRKQSH